MASAIELRAVTARTAAGVPIVSDISLRIAPAESVALVGRSGAGKTTTLRLMNGLVRASSGEVLIDEVRLQELDVIALRRRTGYIIQGSGLFPHRTVYQNIATVPRLLLWREDRIRAAAEPLMERLGLPLARFGARTPRSLSGGEQQRVGIARALIASPSILLCDEPFGALDPIVRHELQEEFRQLRKGVTIVFVTHDISEALRVAGRIVMFDAGRVVADASSSAFCSHPHPLVQRFVESARPAEELR